MISNGIRSFIIDLRRIKYSQYTPREYFLRGNFKKGFALIKERFADYPEYVFRLDQEDIEHLYKKYSIVYDKHQQEEKLIEIENKKEMLKKLKEELKDEL